MDLIKEGTGIREELNVESEPGESTSGKGNVAKVLEL